MIYKKRYRNLIKDVSMPDFVDGFELNKRLSVALQSARRADFAVAFWGAGAAELLGPMNGTKVRIVCNLLSGGTNPNEIIALRERHADIRQLNDLHAKIGVVDNMSFLGSSNMSTNGLGAEGPGAGWREMNVVYRNAREEISRMFETFWESATEINDEDLKTASKVWASRKEGNALAAARRGSRSLVDVLRTAPAELDALNVRMVVYDTVTDAGELSKLNGADNYAREQYGSAFAVYGNWPSIVTDAAKAYLVDYDWPARGQIARGTLYRRNTCEFPDFEQNGEAFHVACKISSIEGITFGNADKEIIRQAFHAYVRAGACGEEKDQRSYNFPISELAPYLEISE